MAEDDSIVVNFADYAERFGALPKSAKAAIRNELSSRQFPDEWKAICLAVLNKLRDEEKAKSGYERVGWSKIRDRIMEDFDAAHPEGFDGRLIRQNLGAWDRTGKISVAQFRFVDRFVTLSEDPNIEIRVAKEVIEDRNRHFMRSISDIYQVRRYDPETAQLIRWVSRFGLISHKISNAWFDHIALRFDLEEAGVIRGIMAYCITDERAKPKRWRALYNNFFIVPVADYQLPEERALSKLGFSMDVFTRKCILLQYMPQYQGRMYRGFAAGELAFTFSNYGMTDSKTYNVTAQIEHPSTTVSPTISLSTEDNKHLNRVDPIMSEYEEGIKFHENGSVEFSPKYYSGEKHRYKYKMNILQEED